MAGLADRNELRILDPSNRKVYPSNTTLHDTARSYALSYGTQRSGEESREQMDRSEGSSLSAGAERCDEMR